MKLVFQRYGGGTCLVSHLDGTQMTMWCGALYGDGLKSAYGDMRQVPDAWPINCEACRDKLLDAERKVED